MTVRIVGSNYSQSQGLVEYSQATKVSNDVLISLIKSIPKKNKEILGKNLKKIETNDSYRPYTGCSQFLFEIECSPQALAHLLIARDSGKKPIEDLVRAVDYFSLFVDIKNRTFYAMPLDKVKQRLAEGPFPLPAGIDFKIANPLPFDK